MRSRCPDLTPALAAPRRARASRPRLRSPWTAPEVPARPAPRPPTWPREDRTPDPGAASPASGSRLRPAGGRPRNEDSSLCAPGESGSQTRRDPTGGPHPTPLGASPGSGAGRGPSPRGSHQARPGPRGGIGLRGRTGTRRARARAAAAASGPRATAAATALSLHRPRRPPPRARPLAPPRPEPPPGPRRRRRPPSALCLPLAAVPAFVCPPPRLRSAPRASRSQASGTGRAVCPSRRRPGVGKQRWQGQDGRAALRILLGGDGFRLRRLRSRDTGRSRPGSGITGRGLGHSLPRFPPGGLARRRRRPHPRPELWGLRDPAGATPEPGPGSLGRPSPPAARGRPAPLRPTRLAAASGHAVSRPGREAAGRSLHEGPAAPPALGASATLRRAGEAGMRGSRSTRPPRLHVLKRFWGGILWAATGAPSPTSAPHFSRGSRGPESLGRRAAPSLQPHSRPEAQQARDGHSLWSGGEAGAFPGTRDCVAWPEIRLEAAPGSTALSPAPSHTVAGIALAAHALVREQNSSRPTPGRGAGRLQLPQRPAVSQAGGLHGPAPRLLSSLLFSLEEDLRFVCTVGRLSSGERQTL
nr:collagen alpha-1(I) chain-like [Pan paniscus]